MMDTPPEEVLESPRFLLHTDIKILVEFVGKRAAVYHKIHLDCERKWNCRLVAAFINELDGIELSTCKYFSNNHYHLFSFKSSAIFQNVLHVYIHDNGNIEIEAHRYLISKYGRTHDFIEQRITDSQGRKLAKPREYTVREYFLDISIQLGSSLALINCLPMIFYPKTSFTHQCHTFIKKFLEIPTAVSMQDKSDIVPLINYKEHWIQSKRKLNTVSSLDDFLNSTMGYLHLNLLRNSTDKNMQRVIIDGCEYSILNGIYITYLLCGLRGFAPSPHMFPHNASVAYVCFYKNRKL